MKKIIAVLLLVTSFLFVGCTTEAPETETPEPTVVDVEAAVEAYLAEHLDDYRVNASIDIHSLNDLIPEVVKQVDSSTLLVANINDVTAVDSSGSAVVYKEEDGYYYAVTNNHVVEGATMLRVYFDDYHYLEAELIGTDAETDLAVIRFEVDEDRLIEVVEFGNIDDLERGQMVVAVGSPGGLGYYNSVTMGIISGLDRFVGIEDLDGDGIDDVFVKMLQHDAAINPGNSGGPLFNIQGEVIGINTIKLVSDDIEGMGFSIYIDVVQRVIEDLEEFGVVHRTRIGVWVQDVRYAPEVPEGILLGVIIQEVMEGGPMDLTSNLEVGDVIVEFGGVEVDGVDRLKDIIFQYHPGDEVEFKYIRDGETFSDTVILGEKE